MVQIKKTPWQVVKEYLVVTLGMLLFVTSWSVFMVPNQIVGGGVSGICSIIQYATGIKMGYSYFVINFILLVLGIKSLGSGFGGKTVYAIVLASVGLNVMQTIIPQEFINQISVSNGRMISTILGGTLVGLGIGITFSVGGSTGGTDIIALMVNKKWNITPGRMILLMDVAIICSSLFVPSYDADNNQMDLAYKISTVVYGLVLVTLNGYVIDLYLSGSKQSVELFIFSENYKKIADGLVKDLNKGVTVLSAKGWYSQKDSYVIMVVSRRTELNLILRYVKMMDPEAFLTVSSVAGVYGKGFDTIKVKPVKGSLMSPEN